MIEWIVFIGITVGASVSGNRLVPSEHQGNYQRCPKDRVYWLAFVFGHSTWMVAAVQSVIDSFSFPLWMRITGAICMAAGYALQIWAWRVNFFLLPIVVYVPPKYRAVSGPYRYCKHPFYLGAYCSASGGVLLLGQWWALCPLIAYLALIMYRTYVEEKLLSANFQ